MGTRALSQRGVVQSGARHQAVQVLVAQGMAGVHAAVAESFIRDAHLFRQDAADLAVVHLCGEWQRQRRAWRNSRVSVLPETPSLRTALVAVLRPPMPVASVNERYAEVQAMMDGHMTMFDNEEGAEEEMRCAACKSAVFEYYSLQIRRADEGATNFARCLACGRRKRLD
jgi:hypothetical protein